MPARKKYAVPRTAQAWVPVDVVNVGKVDSLIEQARLLGEVRTRVWDEFGALKRSTYAAIRDQFMAEGSAQRWQANGLSANAWKETVRDAYADIEAAWTAVAARLRATSEFRKRYPCECQKEIAEDEQFKHADECVRWLAIQALWFQNVDMWTKDTWLHRKMRAMFGRSRNHTHNQIIVRSDDYNVRPDPGNHKLVWLSISSLQRGKRVRLPLVGETPVGTLRIIVEEDRYVRVCWTVDLADEMEIPAQTRGTSGNDPKIGVDKGQRDLLVTSTGNRYGEGFSIYTDWRSDNVDAKDRKRNKLRAIAQEHARKDNEKKRARIEKNNLCKQKKTKEARRHEQIVKTACYTAAHQAFRETSRVVSEDLTWSSFKDKGSRRNRLDAQWLKGTLARALKEVSERRGSTLVIVNAAYSSQICAPCQVFGIRKGRIFYCAQCGVEYDADINAATGVCIRDGDPEITRYTSHAEVRRIYERRAHGLDCLSQDSSCARAPNSTCALSTESESLIQMSNSA